LPCQSDEGEEDVDANKEDLSGEDDDPAKDKDKDDELVEAERGSGDGKVCFQKPL